MREGVQWGCWDGLMITLRKIEYESIRIRIISQRMLKKKNSLSKTHSVQNRHSVSSKKSTQHPKPSKQSLESVFKKLYPNVPNQDQFSSHLVLTLAYKTQSLKVKVPKGVSTRDLPYYLHYEIFKSQCMDNDPERAIRDAANVIGFSTVPADILLDYRISEGIGAINTPISLKCLKYKNQYSTTPLQKYNIIKCLAIGGFSKVYLVRSLANGKFYALKAICKDLIGDNQKETIIANEKNICTMLDHPFIVKLNNCFETNNFLCFIFDFCPGGELFFHLKRIKRMTEDEAKFYFQEILYGLQYLHQQGIIYRDLKPQNLLIGADGHVKIADFGLSKAGMDREHTYSFCGSAEYMPPQMILRTGHSFGVDHYTLGALLYQLVTGLPPFYSNKEDQIKMSILQQQISFPQKIPLSTQIKSLLKGLLTKNPKLRLGSLKGIKEILFHPWLQRVKPEDILDKKLVPPFIPNINEFNFDSNELGQDQKDFTALLMEDRSSDLEMQTIPGFQYEASPTLPSYHLDILHTSFSMTKKKPTKSSPKLKPSASTNCLKSQSLKSLNPNKKDKFKKSSSLKSFTIQRSPSKAKKPLLNSPYLTKQNLSKYSCSVSNLQTPLKNTKIKSTLMKKSIKGLNITKVR